MYNKKLMMVNLKLDEILFQQTLVSNTGEDFPLLPLPISYLLWFIVFLLKVGHATGFVHL